MVIRYGKSSRPISADYKRLVDDSSPGADEWPGSRPLLFKLVCREPRLLDWAMRWVSTTTKRGWADQSRDSEAPPFGKARLT